MASGANRNKNASNRDFFLLKYLSTLGKKQFLNQLINNEAMTTDFRSERQKTGNWSLFLLLNTRGFNDIQTISGLI